MIPEAILKLIYYLKFECSSGTAFRVTINNNNYLITARHLFPNTLLNGSNLEIEIFKKGNWNKLKCTLLLHDNPAIDIAVLDIHSNYFKVSNIDIENCNYYLSQDCFFLGFPFGLKKDDSSGKMNDGFPIPFVKKGIISCFITDRDGVTQIFLDGHNNPGFSGGPVVITNIGNATKNKMSIIGVVSAYVNENKTIKTPIGDFINSENSGIVLTYAFEHVFEIINKKKN